MLGVTLTIGAEPPPPLPLPDIAPPWAMPSGSVTKTSTVIPPAGATSLLGSETTPLTKSRAYFSSVIHRDIALSVIS